VESPRPRWYAHRYNRPEFYRLAAAVAWLPRPVRLRVAARLGPLVMRLLAAERAAVARTLAVATGAEGARLAELTARLFAEYAMCFSDLLSTNRQPLPRLMAHVGRVVGAEHVEALDGALVSVTAHLGNWDMAGRLLARDSGGLTHVVVAPEEARAIETWVRHAGGGVRFVTRSDPTVSIGLLGALRRGERVAMQGDRALGNRGDVRVPFFGRPAAFPIGPFRLAAAAGVPVVPAFCLLRPDLSYELTVSPPLVSRRGSEQDSLRAWVSGLERLVRARPTQWFNFFDIWDPEWTPTRFSTTSSSS
jgi:lauroyl/myristoyl acyltransferase